LIYLFDIDGTILLTGGAGTRALNRVFLDRYGFSDAMRSVQPHGKTDPIILAEVFEDHLDRAPSPDELEAIFDAYVPYLREEVARAERFEVMPGAPEAVRFLATAGVGLGIATGNIQRAARIKLERTGLWECFAFGGYGDDSADRAELVARAMERGRASTGRDVAASDFVVVGDTPRDIDAARACGARVVAVPTGRHGRDELAAHAPDALLSTLWELPDWHRRTTGD